MASNISKNTFDPRKNYTKVVFSQRRPWTDFEWNELQDLFSYSLSGFISNTIGNLSVENSFIVESTGDPNSIIVRKGVIYHNGNPITLHEDVIIDTLHTPGILRTDYVYLDWYIKEVDAIEDPNIVDTINIGFETAVRNKLEFSLNMAEGISIPQPVAGHYIVPIACIQRLPSVAVIDDSWICNLLPAFNKTYLFEGCRVFQTWDYGYVVKAGYGLVGDHSFTLAELTGDVPPNSVRYLYINDQGDFVEAGSLPSAFYVPIAKITSDNSSIVSIEDLRVFEPFIDKKTVSASITEYTADTVLSKYNVVYYTGDGHVSKASSLDNTKVPGIGITLDDAIIGDIIRVVTLGEINDPDITYTAGTILYLSTAGTLTNTPPSAEGQIRQIMGIVRKPGVISIQPELDYIEIGVTDEAHVLTISKICKEATGILRGQLVTLSAIDESVILASNDTPSRFPAIGISQKDAVLDQSLDILLLGEMEKSGWTWTTGSPIYLGVNGLPTQTVPSGLAEKQIIGYAVSPTKILVNFNSGSGSSESSASVVTSKIAQTDLLAYKLVYPTVTSDTVDLAQADTMATLPCIGMTLNPISTGNYGDILLVGEIENIAWSWTPKDLLYVSESVEGDLTNVAPTINAQVVGIALTPTKIFLNPDFTIGAVLTGTSSNTFDLGNGDVLNNKVYYANIGSPSNPYVRFNPIAGRWEFSNDGSTPIPMGGGSGTPWTATFKSNQSLTMVSPSEYTLADVPIDGTEMIVDDGKELLRNFNYTIIGDAVTFLPGYEPLDESLVFASYLTSVTGITPTGLFKSSVELSPVPDGLTNDFYLPETPTLGTELILKNGMAQRNGADCIITGTLVHFPTAPLAGAKLWADYQVSVSGLGAIFRTNSSLSPAPDGTNDTFLFPEDTIAGTKRIFVNGKEANETVDFTFTDPRTVTFLPLHIPLVGSTLRGMYLVSDHGTIGGGGGSTSAVYSLHWVADNTIIAPVNVIDGVRSYPVNVQLDKLVVTVEDAGTGLSPTTVELLTGVPGATPSTSLAIVDIDPASGNFQRIEVDLSSLSYTSGNIYIMNITAVAPAVKSLAMQLYAHAL